MKVQYIAELLYNHECVIVPGLGGFITSYQPARIVENSHRFYPPSCRIAFNSGLSGNDGILANYIAQASNISYKEAMNGIHKWVDEAFRTLHSGGKLQLDNIGILLQNPEGNLEFEPEQKENFLGNSFGLPSFYAKAIVRESIESNDKKFQRVQSFPAKLKYLLPETLKWAAVLAPFIAFTIWGSLNSGKIDNYFQSYTGLFSWVRTTPGKTATIPSNTFVLSPISSYIGKKLSPPDILGKVSDSFSPSAISYDAIRAKGLLSNSEPSSNEIKPEVTGKKYFIIGGAFREHSNAIRMIDELKAMGYPAEIIDTTAKGLFVVSIKGYSARAEALQELSTFKTSGYLRAWILHKS